MLRKLKQFLINLFVTDSKKLKDVTYAIFLFVLLFSTFFNNYIIQLKLERMQSNFFHIFEISQEKFDAMEEINLRIFNSILNNQTRKTFVVGNLTQKNTLLSESLQNNIMNFISDNSTTILAVSGVVLAIGIYYCWQAPINAWFLSFFNNKPKDDDDNKGNGGGSSDVGGNNNGGGSSDIGGNNDVADSSDVGEYSSNAIIPYDEQSATIQEILDLIKPNEFSHNFFTLTNRRGEMVTVDLDFIRQVFPQIYVKNGTPFVRYLDNTEQPLRELKIEDLVSLLDYEYTCALRSENLDHTTEHKEGAISDISDLIEILCKENL
jgi:hypothetical protein